MYSVVRVKEGVLFSKIAPGGFRILSAVEQVCRKLNYGDFTITSACDGVHSGPTDPHPEGKAYDVRSHNFLEAQKRIILNELQALLPSDEFYCFLEKPGTPDEHWHCQVKRGTEYPPMLVLDPEISV